MTTDARPLPYRARRTRIRNTSSIPTETVREILRFVKPAGVEVPMLRVRARKRYAGTSGHYSVGSRHIVLTVGTFAKCSGERLQKFGLKATASPDGNGYLEFYLADQMERIVSVLAHECRHAWQNQGKSTPAKFHLVNGYVEQRPGQWSIIFSPDYFPGAEYRTNVRMLKSPARSRGRRRGMVWGARGISSERDADAYALRTLRAWRRAHRAEPRIDIDTFGSVGSL